MCLPQKFQYQLEEDYADRFVSSLFATESKQKARGRAEESRLKTLAPANNSRSKRKDVKDGEYSRDRIAEDKFKSASSNTTG
jgi:hypothetical protein